MSGRAVVIRSGDILKLYSVNGEGPTEVGRLHVGDLDDHTAAVVGAALADLRDAVTGASRREPMPVARRARAPQPIVANRGGGILAELNRAPAPRHFINRHGNTPDPESLNGRIREVLGVHGPLTAPAILDALGGLERHGAKSPAQRVSSALDSLRRNGKITRTGKGKGAVWAMVDGGA